MKEVAELLNAMRDAGVISDYALFGAIAQMRYTEPLATLAAEVLVSVPPPQELDLLEPISEFCAARGYAPEGEAVRVGAWPVQFVPVFSQLTQEALEQAETADFEGAPLRVVRADHLAVIALSGVAQSLAVQRLCGTFGFLFVSQIRVLSSPGNTIRSTAIGLPAPAGAFTVPV